MNGKSKNLTCAAIRTLTWAAILRKPVLMSVIKLQRRIAKASMKGRWGKVYALQRILTTSFSAKVLAVIRVTSNKGANTPGVDKKLWMNNYDKLEAIFQLKRKDYKSLPLRRIYIPKKDKDKLRPLSIPTIKDRGMQALYKLALEPVAETLSDPNSYGFRKYRSCADAIQQCFICLAKDYHAKWVFEADIKGCFDNISHDWLIRNIPMDKTILRKWLKTGYTENNKKYETIAGTPQGGIISPVLMNMTLDGLEKEIRKQFPRWKNAKVNFIRYADDFIITAKDRETIINQIQPLVVNFLKERGLDLSPEKTHITHIDKGFDFLSQNVRKYNGKLLIKPAKKAIKLFKEKIKHTIQDCRGNSAVWLIHKLNPIIRGWVNYHKHIVAKKTFWNLSKYIFDKLLKWAKSEHSNKKIHWIWKKYFTQGDHEGRFAIKQTDEKGNERIFQLFAIGRVPIRRFVKIRANFNPFDQQFDEYLQKRFKNKKIASKITHQKTIILLNKTSKKKKTTKKMPGKPEQASSMKA